MLNRLFFVIPQTSASFSCKEEYISRRTNLGGISMKSLFILIALLVPGFVLAQTTHLEGRIVDEETNEPIPYAKITNVILQTGAISDQEGYFRIPLPGPGDSIRVSHIGYERYEIAAPADVRFLRIPLAPEAALMEEVVINPSDDSYLYKMIVDCRKNATTSSNLGKGYYELKTYRDEQQIELVEGFYNVKTSGYDIDQMDIKAGRLALLQYRDRLFASLQSSQALLSEALLQKSPYHPISPLQFNRRKLQKLFFLDLEKQYISPAQDSIYVIAFYPRNRNGNYFEGKVWVNITQNGFEGVNLTCPDCKRHPFLPLFPSDSLLTVNLDITKTFSPINGKMGLNHQDFDYEIRYLSKREGMGPDSVTVIDTFSIQSQVLLYVYDPDHSFFIPDFDFGPFAGNDYRKINALPYNTFFWNFNDEYRLYDQKGSNQKFFKDPRTLTNLELFQKKAGMPKSLFESPYVKWSDDRVFIHEVVRDSMENTDYRVETSEKYHFSIRIFADHNVYGDSTDVLTRTVFSPQESYYHLPINKFTYCFLNILFDLCEIERRALQAKLKAASADPEELTALCKAFKESLEVKKREWLKAMDLGANKRQMIRLNQVVKDELGIDNIAFFRLYEPEEELDLSKP